MVAIKMGLVAIIFFASSVTAAETFNLELKNNLEKCVILGNKGVTFSNDIPILQLSVKPISDTGACGCKSAISQYSVYSIREDYQALIISSEFTLAGRAELQLPIAAQKQIIARAQKIKVLISCADPA